MQSELVARRFLTKGFPEQKWWEKQQSSRQPAKMSI
jgi:hypothetical protein